MGAPGILRSAVAHLERGEWQAAHEIVQNWSAAHLPDHWPRKYGTVKFQPPASYLGQLAYPFQRKQETPYG